MRILFISALLGSAHASTTLPRAPSRLAAPSPLELGHIGMAPSGGPRRPDPERHANIGRAIDCLQSD